MSPDDSAGGLSGQSLPAPEPPWVWARACAAVQPRTTSLRWSGTRRPAIAAGLLRRCSRERFDSRVSRALLRRAGRASPFRAEAG